MNKKVIRCENYDKVYFHESDCVKLNQDDILLETIYSMISPGTELFCIDCAIKDGNFTEPGYIQIASDEKGNTYFVFPSMSESSGAHCDRRFLSKNSIIIKLDKDMKYDDAAFLRFINIGLHAFNRSVKNAGKICVFGLGPVGNIACQTAKILGYEVTGIDSCEKRLALAGKCGIAKAVKPDYLGKVTDEYDFVIDTVAADATLSKSLEILKPGGSCSVTGIVKPGQLKAADMMTKIWQKDLNFFSGWEMKSRFSDIEDNLYRAMNWIKAGYYNFAPLLTATLTADVSEIRDAYKKLKENPSENISFLIRWK